MPKKINVGYQNRSDTYTGKLAYVIYYDEKGVLRKEKSWNSWKDESIPNNEFDNIPTEGFVLNKHAGGVENSCGWNARKSYCRVYDPRGFEFEITIENLLYILENADSIKGKGLQGEFVYAWDGKDLFLMPVESPDYKEVMNFSNIVNNNLTIKAKDLIIGATYLTKDNEKWVYMGRYDKWDKYCYAPRDNTDIVFSTYKQLEKWCEQNNIEKPYGRLGYKRQYSYTYCAGMVGKRHVFCNLNKTSQTSFEWLSSINKKLISVIDNKCCDNYADLFYELEGTEKYSPVDKTLKEYIPMTYEEFFDKCHWDYDGGINYKDTDFVAFRDGKYSLYRASHLNWKEDKYKIKKYIDNCHTEDVFDIFPTEETEEWITYNKKKVIQKMIPVTLKEIYDEMKPMCKQTYLKNGRKYEKVWEL